MPPVTPPVVLVAPAKLTLSLRITGVHPDGYHLLDAEMVGLDLADRLELRTAAGPESRIEVVDDAGQPVDAGPAADNLVARALAAVGRTADVRVTKRIPPGAGLGGGSADAGAVLRWAGVADLVLAAELGADVPFCLVGGRARVRGIGELVDPLPHEETTYTLLTPPFGCSTAAVYQRWDELGGPHDPRTGPGNDLEAAALSVEPRLAEWRDRLGEASDQVPQLAGSGSTWFVPGAFPGDGRVVVRATAAFASRELGSA